MTFLSKKKKDPDLEMRSDLDFKIWLDPIYKIRSGPDPVLRSKIKIHIKLNFSCAVYIDQSEDTLLKYQFYRFFLSKERIRIFFEGRILPDPQPWSYMYSAFMRCVPDSVY